MLNTNYSNEGWEKEFNALFGKDKHNPFTIDVPTVKSFISKVRDSALQEQRKEILDFIQKNYLDYCMEQNGRSDCKNCGLCIEDFSLINKE